MAEDLMAGAPTGPAPEEGMAPEMGGEMPAPEMGAPGAEMGMPGAEMEMPGAEMPGPLDEAQMRADIERDFATVKSKAAELHTQNYINRNKIRQAKMQLMKQVFDILEGMGVDPNNLDSINNFLSKLEKQDPDLVELFEMVINGMSPDEEAAPAPEEDNGLMEGVVSDQQKNILRQ